MSSPGRILFICHDGQIYGSQQSLALILKHLSASTYRCLVSMARSGPLIPMLEKISFEKNSNIVILSHRRLQWVKHDTRSMFQKAGDIFALFCLVLPRTFCLLNAIYREKVNVVHTNSVVSLEGAVAAKLSGIPHVWHIRELFMTDNPKLYMSLGKRFSRWVIHHFSDRVLCISEAVKNQFGPYVSKNPEKYVVLYNALELEEQPLVQKRLSKEVVLVSTTAEVETGLANHESERKLEDGNLSVSQPDGNLTEFTIGFIGRLSEGKRFQDLLEAAVVLREKGIQFNILAAGNFVDAAYETKIQELLQRHNLTGIVRLLGYQTDLKALYEQLDLLVVPSYNEPFGRVVIEAMANNIPCVATNSGGIPEIITHGETGWLYPAKDAKALALVLENLLRHPDQLNPIRENARRMVMDRFTIGRQIGKLDACYQEILSQHR